MDDRSLENRAIQIIRDADDVIADLIEQIEAYETINEDYQNTIGKLEDDAEQLANTLEETIKLLQQSELERLELVQFIKKYNYVDI